MRSSPYAIGVALGLLNTFAFATAKRGLGVTTAFESAAARAGRRVAPDAMNVNAYIAKREDTPKVDWESLLVLGVIAGGFLASRSGTRPRAKNFPSPESMRAGSIPGKRYAAALVGGAVMMFGARMAMGCTSGHALTGTAQLALSSWVFSPLMFATAATAARLLYGKEARR